MKKMKIAYVEWRCWQNFGGEHYSAEIEINDDWVDVVYSLTESQAKKLNKIDTKNYPTVGVSAFDRNKPGDKSKRFFSFSCMFKDIMRLLITNDIDILFVGDGVTLPSEVMYSKNPEHKLKLNVLYSIYHKNDSDENIDNWKDCFTEIKIECIG